MPFGFTEDELREVGGKSVSRGQGGQTEWNFGWIPPQDRNGEQQKAHADAERDEVIPFSIIGTTDETEEKVDLTDVWKHPLVREAIGFEFPGVHQYTGSCVGAGGGNMLFTLAAIEVVRLGDPEEIVVPFWLLPYGRSRFYGGMRGRGEGSFGSTFAKACREDGTLPAKTEGLPDYKLDDGLSWYKAAELQWSDGGSISKSWLDKARKHLISAVGEMKSADDVEQSIRNRYPVTNASSLIPDPKVVSEGFAFGRVQRAGGHQTTFLGVWNHPQRGRIFKYVNQWGLRWGYLGACWIPDEDVDAIIKNGRETYSFSQFGGFPAQTLPLWM